MCKFSRETCIFSSENNASSRTNEEMQPVSITEKVRVHPSESVEYSHAEHLVVYYLLVLVISPPKSSNVELG